WDGAVGLYYYRARHYAPQLGRFIQADPAGYVDGPNVYVYVDNGPTYFADPTGSVKVSVTNEIRLEKKKFVETWKYRYSDGSCYRHVLSEDHSDRLLAKTKSTMIGLVETRDDGARFFRDIDIHIDVPVNHASGNWTYDWWQLVIDARPVVGEKWTVNGGCDECVAGHVAWKAIMGKVASQRTISVQIGYGPIKMTGGLEASADIIMAQISYWHEFKICTSDAEEQVARISNIDAESAYFTDFWVDTSEHLISHNNFVKKRVQRYGWKKLYVRE
ncbi:MAG: RHS repeat-associated core domain-containing protein, partial [Verrucomicrobia bacterium]|nr:RHS repeat-associated core domain-containing protein [Verrucomicrobiota bacterium]